MKTIPLTQGYVALVDDADFEAANAFKWCAATKGRGIYAKRGLQKPNGKWTAQYLHQFLLPGVPQIDHFDGDGRNNQRENLRVATGTQNLQGFQRKRPGATSKFRGVSWDRRDLKWRASIHVDDKDLFLGNFDDEAEAARAYDEAARSHFKDFACPNFI